MTDDIAFAVRKVAARKAAERRIAEAMKKLDEEKRNREADSKGAR